MNQAFYDPDSGHVWMTVGGQLQPYPPHTLIAAVEDNGLVSVRRLVGGAVLAMAEAATFMDRDSRPLGDTAAATAYLNGEFAKWIGPTRGPRGPGIFSGYGDPDPGLGMAGDLYIDAASGDLYRKET